MKVGVLKRKSKPKEKKPEHECEYCNRTFTRESTLFAHMCTKRRKWLDKDEKHVRMAFSIYCKVYDSTSRKKVKPRDYGDFVESNNYVAFVKFARYLLDIQAMNPEAFVDFLIKTEIPMKNWDNEIVYEQFIRELNKKEDAVSAFERNVLLLQQWADDTQEEWFTFFEKVNTNLAVKWIRSGRLSPWVLYAASNSEKLFNRFTSEQMKLIEQYVNPKFWSMKFSQNPQDLKFIKDLLKEAGV